MSPLVGCVRGQPGDCRYSCAKRCTNEGRALMQLDFQQLVRKLETITVLRPIPERSFVENYIKAYYLPESALEQWIAEHTVRTGLIRQGGNSGFRSTRPNTSLVCSTMPLMSAGRLGRSWWRHSKDHRLLTTKTRTTEYLFKRHCLQ